MKLATREKWMLALLPTAIGALAYMFLSSTGVRVEALEARFDRAVDALPAQSEVAAARRDARQARDDELAAIERRDAALASLGQFTAEQGRPADSDVARRVSQFTTLFEENGLSLIASEPAASGRSDSGRPWQLQFAGSWGDFERAVSAAAADPALRFVPLSMEMEPSGNTPATKIWTLVIAV